MQKIVIYLSLSLLHLLACTSNSNPSPDLQQIRQDVQKTEAAFAAMAKEKGVGAAFTYYAAEEAVISRNNRLIQGKEAISAYFAQYFDPAATLEWTTEFVEVSSSGDLAYTYGPYTFKVKDPQGQESVNQGYFHTVWKKQADGSWKFVWD